MMFSPLLMYLKICKLFQDRFDVFILPYLFLFVNRLFIKTVIDSTKKRFSLDISVLA